MGLITASYRRSLLSVDDVILRVVIAFVSPFSFGCDVLCPFEIFKN
jgi:hypothetical protein